MNETKQKALEKMLTEMNKQHGGAEDAVHNWLCDQDDEKLFEGILKKDRTIKGSMKYCVSEASKQQTGNAAVVDDQTVFMWVKTYFVSDKVPKMDTNVSAKVTPVKKTPKKKAEKKQEPKKSNLEGEQLSLLDML